jgi:hypothetical protein
MSDKNKNPTKKRKEHSDDDSLIQKIIKMEGSENTEKQSTKSHSLEQSDETKSDANLNKQRRREVTDMETDSSDRDKSNKPCSVWLCTNHPENESDLMPVTFVVDYTVDRAKASLIDFLQNKRGVTGIKESDFTLVKIDLFTPQFNVLSCSNMKYKPSRPEKGIQIIGAKKLRLFYCKDHYSEYPIPGISYAISNNVDEAKKEIQNFVDNSFKNNKGGSNGFSVVEIDSEKRGVTQVTSGGLGGKLKSFLF